MKNGKGLTKRSPRNTDIKVERYWCMPSHKTFSIKPFKKLLKDELDNDYIDPFPHPYKQDAIEYLKTIDDLSTPTSIGSIISYVSLFLITPS